MRGKIIYYNSPRAFGFIFITGLPDVFVHINDCQDETELYEGDEVEFIIENTSKGRQARDVKKINQDSVESNL